MFLKLVHLSSKSFNILYFNSQDKMTLKKLKNNEPFKSIRAI